MNDNILKICKNKNLKPGDVVSLDYLLDYTYIPKNFANKLLEEIYNLNLKKYDIISISEEV